MSVDEGFHITNVKPCWLLCSGSQTGGRHPLMGVELLAGKGRGGSTSRQKKDFSFSQFCGNLYFYIRLNAIRKSLETTNLFTH